MPKDNIKKLFEIIKDDMESYGIEIYNIEYISDNAIDFKIKGLKNWKWGAWYCKPGLTEELGFFEIFCQYERFIDKFKPSRGAFCVKVKFNQWVDKDKKEEIYVDTYDTYRVSSVVHFIKKHEAMAFVYENDITSYRGELYAKWSMFRDIAVDIWEKWTRKRVYKKMHRWAKIFSFLKCVNVAYNRDIINEDADEENQHINDRWYILPLNSFGEWIAKAMKKLLYKSWCLGTVKIENDEVDFLWDTYDMSLKSKEYTFEKIIENEDGTVDVDEDELWAIVNQMADTGDIILYGDI